MVKAKISIRILMLPREIYIVYGNHWANDYTHTSYLYALLKLIHHGKNKS